MTSTLTDGGCRDELASLPRRAADAHDTRTALVFGERRWSFTDLLECVDAAADRIARHCRHGDRVVIVGANSDHAVIVILAAIVAGGVAVPLQADTPGPRLHAILRDCAPALVVGDDARIGVVDGWSGPVETLDVLCARPWKGGRASAPLVRPTDAAVILYTSGSTGTPRGVVWSHGQTAFCTAAVNSVVGNTDRDVVLSGRPLSFVYGLHQVFLSLSAGATLILTDVTATASLARVSADERVTGLPLAPSVVAALLYSRALERIALPALRYITSTGDTLSAAHIRALRGVLPHVAIMPMYGLTECGRVSIMPPGAVDGRERSVGVPVPGTAVRLLAEDGTPEAGELLVQGRHLSEGYWHNPHLTRERFVTDPRTGVRELHTGDLFRRDDEGFLYFVSRAETMIKSYGELVSPSEVECVIGACPGVLETAVVGVPSGTAGESIVAFVCHEGLQPDVRRLREHCGRHLTSASRPTRLVFTSEPLPKTVNGKIDRQALRQAATRSRSSA